MYIKFIICLLYYSLVYLYPLINASTIQNLNFKLSDLDNIHRNKYASNFIPQDEGLRKLKRNGFKSELSKFKMMNAFDIESEGRLFKYI